MSRVPWVLVATALLAACPARRGPHGSAVPDDIAVRVRIAHAEVTRGAAIDELVELAMKGERATRALAIRGLGRVGSERVIPMLVTTLHDPDPWLASIAAGALGVVSQLDGTEPTPEI